MPEEQLGCVSCGHDLAGHRYVQRDEGLYCVNCFNDKLANSCYACAKIIHPSHKSFGSEGNFWHEKCFTCFECQASLVEQRFGIHDKKTYCANCYDGSFAPTCFKCSELIRSGSKKLTWREHDYHESCLSCKNCSASLGGDPFHPRGEDGENYCMDCFKELFAHKCSKCTQPIVRDGVLHEGSPHHADCFVCSECKDSLREKQFVLLDQVGEVCSQCYAQSFADRCQACNQPITAADGDKHMSFEGKKWHEKCMACKFCQKSLVDIYFLAEGKEDSALDIMCLDCGLRQKGLDPDKYRDGIYNEEDMSDEEEGVDTTSDPFKLDVLEVQNMHRAKHGHPKLIWSDSCAKHAQAWADKLIKENKFEHSDNPRYGENIAKALKTNVTADEIVWHWYREYHDYDFSNLEFQPGTGHWAQVIWKSTKYCGVGVAKTDKEVIVVANYKCPGNMLGQFEKNVSKAIVE